MIPSSPRQNCESELAGGRIEYKASVADDLSQIDASTARRIVIKIRKGSARRGSGKALAGEFAGLYRLRVKDHRVIYARTTEGYLVLRIGHRDAVYRKGRPGL